MTRDQKIALWRDLLTWCHQQETPEEGRAREEFELRVVLEELDKSWFVVKWEPSEGGEG